MQIMIPSKAENAARSARNLLCTMVVRANAFDRFEYR
jgi:hypothetical protein